MLTLVFDIAVPVPKKEFCKGFGFHGVRSGLFVEFSVLGIGLIELKFAPFRANSGEEGDAFTIRRPDSIRCASGNFGQLLRFCKT